MLTLSKLLTQACYEGFFKLGIKVMEKFISFTDLKTESYGSLYSQVCLICSISNKYFYIWIWCTFTSYNSDINVTCLLVVLLDYKHDATNDYIYTLISMCLFFNIFLSKNQNTFVTDETAFNRYSVYNTCTWPVFRYM